MNRRIADVVARLWRASAPLTVTGLLMVPILGANLIGLIGDDRLVTNAPVWLKPAKFAASVSIYTLSLAWVMTYLTAWRRTRQAVGWTTAIVLAVEIAIINLQAWRGVASHFNVATPLDAVLFGIMGAAIVLQTFTSVAVAVALWRERFRDRAAGWALRLGFTIAIVGALSGGFMTRPTPAQLAEAQTGRLTVAGAHTVGAPDGGAGLPGTGWSVEHGDLRIPHFIGLHALQAFALLLFALPRRWPDVKRARVMIVGAMSYAALFLILLAQALNGEPIVAPTTITVIALAGWALATAAGIASVIARDDRAYPHHLICEEPT